jgi:GGDEF domain-containing protein
VSDDFLDPRRAERLTRAARAAQTLSETLWEALHEELTDPRARRVVEFSERLGEVAATVALLAQVEARTPEASALPVEPGYVEPESRVARVPHDEPPADEPPLPWEPSATQEPRSAAVLVDELAPVAPVPEEPHVASAAPESTTYRPPTVYLGEEDRLRQAPPEIEIRDVRGEEGPGAWIGSIGRQLERHEQDSSPFAVLLVELIDIGRLRHAEPLEEVSRLTGQVEDALSRELRPVDSLTREGPGRYWLLASQTGGTGAQMLAERLARAVRSSANHRGTPLEVAIGIAVCPDDGRQASALAAHADVGLYAARAAGRSSIGELDR